MEDSKTKLNNVLTILAMAVAVLVIAMIITEIKNYRFIGGGVSATNTIAVSGESEVYATPDIATITFSVREESKKLADAQDKVNKKVQTALAEVRKAGVAEKDIKLQNYSSYPKYEWTPGNVSCMGLDCPPAYPGKQVLMGYEVSQSVIITVRNLDAVNALVDGLGTAGVTDMQGPNFAIDKKDALEAEARKQAIDKARAKAEVLADDLGVTLVRVVSFSEGGNYPIYGRPMMALSKEASGGDSSMPELPQGEEKITSNVTITYEIR
ncbi:MAG: SIMPL domain-containing protein [Patescibacteria group bacterium]